MDFDARKFNAKQLYLMQVLANAGPATFDRWQRVVINKHVITSHHSTVPNTLFRNGMVAVLNDRLYLTVAGLNFLRDLKIQVPENPTCIIGLNIVKGPIGYVEQAIDTN